MSSSANAVSFPYKRLLFIEDDELDAYIGSLFLFHFHTVSEIAYVPTGQHALDYLELYGVGGGKWPDLIFLNIELPRIDGFYYLKIFQKRGYLSQPGVKLFMYTCSDHPDYPIKARELGANGYINKPITPGRIEQYLITSDKQS
jgi:DNA-binding response OmpR family regulator